VECLDRLYLNGYIGELATGPGLVFFMRDQLGNPPMSFRQNTEMRRLPPQRSSNS